MPESRVDLFDAWASSYDRSVTSEDYPFAGYDDVIDAVAAASEIQPDHRVLDVGAGTGKLTGKLLHLADEVWGTDFSDKMLMRAQTIVPQAHFVCWDARDDWSPELPSRFDRIVSTYVLHAFDDDAKLRLLSDLAQDRLNRSGHLVVEDIAFLNDEAQTICKQNAMNAWDESDHYWIASPIVPRLEDAGFIVGYKQVSFCGGVFTLRLKAAT